MDKGIQKSQTTLEGNQRHRGTDHKSSRCKKAGRPAKEQETGINEGDLISVIQHYFPHICKRLSSVKDPRCADRIFYHPELLIFETILERLCGTDARSDISLHRRESLFRENLETILGEDIEELPHGDTIAYFLQKLDPDELKRIRREMIRDLHKKKTLSCCKYEKYYLLAIDGVHLHTSGKPIPYSIKVKHRDGRIEYRQYALEAKLISPKGIVFSFASTFISNDGLPIDADQIKTGPDGKIVAFPKQDCELKALKRLLAEIHEQFPKWKFLLLLDGLYMTTSVLDICHQYDWAYSITLKEGSAQKLYRNAIEKIEMDTHNRIRNGDSAILKWCNNVPWEVNEKKYRLNVIGTDNTGKWSFLYATSLFIHKTTAEELQNGVCRERWKIENQGFREQKHCGLELEKAFGTRGNAAQNFYLIVQIAHIIRVLMINSSLFRTLQRIDSHGKIEETICKPMLDFFGTIKNFVKKFAQSIFKCRLKLRHGEFERLEFGTIT